MAEGILMRYAEERLAQVVAEVGPRAERPSIKRRIRKHPAVLAGARNRLREWQLSRYGLTEHCYKHLYKRQNGQCAICDRELRLAFDIGIGHGTRANIDHCHKTGLTRALLCTRCNGGLGDFLDSPELLRKAADYLERHARDASDSVE
jgi:hypothetical protein